MSQVDVRASTSDRLRGMNPLAAAGLPRVPDDAVLPPGPSWPPLLQTIALLRFRHWLHPYCHRRYGDTFTVRVAPRGRPLVLTSRPEHAKEIFATDPEFAHAGKGNMLLGPIMGRHSLLLQDSMEHKRARRLLMPAFNGQALKGYADLISDLARDEIATWRDDAEFRSLDRMNALTLEIILRVVFGVTDEQRLAALRPRVTAVVEIGPSVLLGWNHPVLTRHGPWKRFVENQYELDELIHAEIRERRRAPDLVERTDVLSRLMLAGTDAAETAAGNAVDHPLDDVELRDQLVTLLLAGHETTATALAWSLYEVGRSPQLRERAQRAVAEGDDVWLEAVLKEAMRLHPIIPMVGRTLLRPTTIAGYELPAGTTVGPSIILAHRREDDHERPGEFRPERFIGANPPTNSWIPFGGGVRRCIGAGFSLMEGVAVLREVFSTFDVEARGHDEPKVRNITSVPRRGARVRVHRR